MNIGIRGIVLPACRSRACAKGFGPEPASGGSVGTSEKYDNATSGLRSWIDWSVRGRLFVFLLTYFGRFSFHFNFFSSPSFPSSSQILCIYIYIFCIVV